MHGGEAFVPAFDDLALAERKGKRLAPVERAVEFLALLAVDEQPSCLGVVAVFAAPPSFAPVRSETVGFAPRGVTIDNVGNVFVANRQSNNVFEFDSSGTRIREFKVGRCPENMAIDSKGDVWVTNSCSSTVSVLKRVAVPSPSSDGDSNG
jgi:hypothetical protein